MQHDIGQLRDEKKHLLGLIQELKTKAVETFTECSSLNEENAKLKNQLKSREILEQNNLEKVQAFAEKYQLMNKMLQAMDLDYQQLQEEYRSLV